MSLKEIMEAIQKLYDSVDSMGYTEIRPAVKKMLRCVFALAKIQAEQAGGTPKSLRKSKPAAKARR